MRSPPQSPVMGRRDQKASQFQGTFKQSPTAEGKREKVRALLRKEAIERRRGLRQNRYNSKDLASIVASIRENDDNMEAAEFTDASLFEWLEEELRKDYEEHEDQMMAEYYEQELEREEASIEAFLSMNCEPDVIDDELLCPVCRTFHLMHHDDVFFCKCGMRIQTKMIPPLSTYPHLQDAAINKEYLVRRMRSVFRKHTTSCFSYPIAEVKEGPLGTNLVLKCSNCDLFSILI